MTTPNIPDRPALGKDASAEEVEADIARTREELADTVDALTQKLDVKAQAQNKAYELKDRAGEQVHAARVQSGATLEQLKESAIDERGQLKPAVPAVAVGLVAVSLAVVIWRRRQG